jgi:hypothetical protein
MASIYAQKMTVGHPVVRTMNNSIALIGVIKRWATWLKGKVHTSHGTAALLQKRKATPNCTLGACNPVNFTIFNLNETGWEVGKKFDILIFKKQTKEIDAGTLLHFQLIVLTHESSSLCKGQFSSPVGELICLGQKFYNDATQETQWWGGSQSHEAPTSPAG